MRKEIINYKHPNHSAKIVSEENWPKGELSTLHFHPDFEFLYIISGKMRLNKNDDLIATSGEIIFINSRAPHSTEFLDDGSPHTKGDSFITMVQFKSPDEQNEDILKYLSRLLKQNAIPYFIFKPDDPDYQELLHCIIDLSNNNKKPDISSNCFITSNVYRILGILYKRKFAIPKQNLINANDLTYFLPTFIYIENQYNQQISLAEIASSISLSREYFCRAFKKAFNISVFDYLNFMRVQKSTKLLEQNLAISDVSEKVGFSSPTYFNRIFKKYMALSPSDYRKLYKDIP